MRVDRQQTGFGDGEGGIQASPWYRMAVLTATALFVGAGASLAAILFVDCVTALNNLLLVSPRARVHYEEIGWLVPLATVCVPAAGGLIVGLLLAYISPDRRPLGPPDVIRSVQFREHLPDMRSGAVSTVAAALSLGFGASVGQYGPMVYLGAMFGGLVRKLRLGVPNLRVIAISCGVAAAIATAFNAPIAGLVFAHEVVLRHYSTQAFAPTTVAAAVGYILANVVFERPPLFLVQFGGVENGHEFALFGLLGVLAAGVAMLFMGLALKSAQAANQSPLPAPLRPAAAGLAVGLTALWLPDVLGIGTEALRFATIEGAFEMGELLVLVVAKIVLTALCIGFGFSGGVFSPALLIGVLSGALYWMAVDATGLVVTSGVAVYALCGMMAVASPVIGGPLTTIIIVFELTRNYDITIAAMVAVVFANLITHRLFGRSLFDVQLAGRGVDLSWGRDRARLDSIPVQTCATDDFVHITTAESAKKALARIRASEWKVGFVTDRKGIYMGLVTEPRRGAKQAKSVTALVGEEDLRFDETTTIMQAMHALKGFVGDTVPVVERASGKLLGVVTEADIVQAYLDISQTLRREENASL